MIYTSDNLNQFNETFRQYHAAGKKTWEACVLKQSKEYAIKLAAVTKAMAPSPGSIRARLLAMLKSGRGLKIKNYQAQNEETSSEIVNRSFLGNTGAYGRSKKDGRTLRRTQAVRKTKAVRAMYDRITRTSKFGSMAGSSEVISAAQDQITDVRNKWLPVRKAGCIGNRECHKLVYGWFDSITRYKAFCMLTSAN